MGRKEPPTSVGKLTGFPYGDLWEEFGDPWERLYDHGYDRDLIDRAFKKARKLGASDLRLTKAQIRRTIAPFELSSSAGQRLAQRLFYLAGHYYSPRFHKLFGDAPSDVQRLLRRVAATATKLEKLMSKVSHATWRQVGAARWTLKSERRGRPDVDWAVLQDQIADLSKSSGKVADEFPRAGRGTTEKVLQGRWLRQSAEAIEKATGRKIQSKVSDSAGPNFRFEGVDGAVIQSYCLTVDKGPRDEDARSGGQILPAVWLRRQDSQIEESFDLGGRLSAPSQTYLPEWTGGRGNGVPAGME